MTEQKMLKMIGIQSEASRSKDSQRNYQEGHKEGLSPLTALTIFNADVSDGFGREAV